MKTNDIIEKLVRYKKTHKDESSFSLLFTDYLIEYFDKLDIPKEETDFCYRTELHLPVLLLRAVTMLNESSESWIVEYRDKYKVLSSGENKITDMISIGNKSLSASYDIHEFIKILEKAIGLKYIDYSMLYAEGLVLMLKFNQFIDKIYVNGDMGDFVRDHKYSRIEGIFGETKFAYDEALGGFYMIFSRKIDGVNYYIQFQFDCEAPALGSGLRHCEPDLITALTMIKEVQDNWDLGKFIMV